MRLNELDYTIVFLPSLARACSSYPTSPKLLFTLRFSLFILHFSLLTPSLARACSSCLNHQSYSSLFILHFSFFTHIPSSKYSLALLLTLDVGMLSSARVLLRFLYGFHQEYSNPQGIQLRTVVPRESPNIQYICQVLYNNSHH